eukprot:scaffold1380_cov290-Chaetoceros_neogracile.AAC.3
MSIQHIISLFVEYIGLTNKFTAHGTAILCRIQSWQIYQNENITNAKMSIGLNKLMAQQFCA